MIWTALLLIGVGVTDLVFSVRPMRHLPEVIGAALVVLVGLASDLTDPESLLMMALIAVIVLAWGQAVTRGFASGRTWVPLLVFGAGLALMLVYSPLDANADGAIGWWLEVTPLGVLAGLRPEEALLLAGVMLCQLSTGNVLVRLVLSATGTSNPARAAGRAAPSYRLKGGRLLGPMERIFIVGLGLAGELTAASVVVAAKGLLRWPELQAAREERGPGIHVVTEYFLVGSFVSWTLALGSLVLLA